MNRAEFILAIFPLGLHSFIIGDKNEEYPFFCYEKNENIPFIKTHHLDLQKSRSITQDKYEIYPSFLITYQLGNVLTKETTTINIISSLSKFMQKNQRSGEVQSFIQELIEERIIALWKKVVNGRTLQDIFAPYPECGLNRVILEIQESLKMSTNFVQNQHLVNNPISWVQTLPRQEESFDYSLMNIKIFFEDLNNPNVMNTKKGMQAKQ